MQSTDKKMMIPNTSLSNLFGTCLVEIRKSHSLSQKVVAIDASMDQSYLAGLETGRRPPPRERQLNRLMQALRVSDNEKTLLKQACAFYRLMCAVDELEKTSCLNLQTENLIQINLSKTHQDILSSVQQNHKDIS